MSIELMWAQLPEGEYIKTVCRDGVPIYEATLYLAQSIRSYGSPKTSDTYAEHLLRLFQYLDRTNLRLADLFYLRALTQFEREIAEVSEGAAPDASLHSPSRLSESTIRAIVDTARRFVDHLRHEAGYANGNIALLSARHPRYSSRSPRCWPSPHGPRKKKKVPAYLTENQLDAVRVWIAREFQHDKALLIRNRAILELGWDGALRRGALLAVGVSDCDWQNGWLKLSARAEEYVESWRSKQRNPRTCKTGEHIVTLSEQTILLLHHYCFDYRPAEAIRLGHGILFCEHRSGTPRHGRPMSLATLNYLFEAMSRCTAEGGVGFHVNPHMLRHTWATMARTEGLKEEVIQKHLGHASITSTRLYTHIPDEEVRETIASWRRSHRGRYLVELP